MAKKNIKPELVSPAGSWSSLMAAVEAGADSVYFGIKGLNMRSSASNFDVLQLNRIMDYLHSRNKKGYLALNVIMMDKDLPRVARILKAAKQAKIDAVVSWDMAVLSIARDLDIDLHLSTQASVANLRAVKFFSLLGLKRIVLARECTLVDIRNIVKQLDEEGAVEIECFIHGAMCLSVSGRCFLSSYSFGKSANRGQCLQPCRREFRIKDVDDESEYIAGQDYLLSPKDLCTIDFIDELVDAGISAFKIEGRTRSPEYTKTVTSVYRRGIDYSLKGKLTKTRKKSLKKELLSVYSRGFSSGFYFGRPEPSPSRKLEHTHHKVFLGEVCRFYKKISVAEVLIRSRSLKTGDRVIFLGKTTSPEVVTIRQIESDHVSIAEAKRGQRVGIKVPLVVKPKDKVFLWEKRTD